MFAKLLGFGSIVQVKGHLMNNCVMVIATRDPGGVGAWNFRTYQNQFMWAP